MLPNNKLLHSICCANLRDQLYDLGIPVSSIASNNQGATLRSLWDRKNDRGHEGFAIVRLLENYDLFAKPRAAIFISYALVWRGGMIGSGVMGKLTFRVSGQ